MFERFIARQAIQKDNLTLLGYELRFRANDSRAGASNGFPAAYLIDASTMVFHRESLTANALAFASLGEPELLSGVGLVLPRSKAVIEIAESVPCTAEVILACQSLKTAGYRLALTGLIGNAERSPLAMLAGAISLPGEREFRRWAAIVALVMIGAEKPAELIRTAPTRVFLRRTCPSVGTHQEFICVVPDGLLSTADALLAL